MKAIKAMLVGLMMVSVATSALAAKEEKPSLSSEVAAKLKPAQDAIQKGDFEKGIQLASEALAIATKPYDKDQSLQFMRFGYGKKIAATGNGVDPEGYTAALNGLGGVLEQMEELGLQSVDDRLKNLKIIAQIHAQNKDFEGAIKYADRWAQATEATKDNEKIHESYSFLASLHLMQKDYANGAMALEKAVAAVPATETELRQLYLSYYNLKDNAKREAVLTQLALQFGKPDYYADLISLYQEASTPDNVMLEMYRYCFEFGVMTRESQYVEYADMANSVGSPTEAARVIHKGVDSGAVKLISPTDRNSRLVKLVDQGAADDKRDFAKLEKEFVARKNGDIDVKLGMSYLMQGDTDKAIDAISRGLSAERVAQVKKPESAYMLLGLAQYRKGDKAAAVAAFSKAQQTPSMSKVAALWLAQLQK